MHFLDALAIEGAVVHGRERAAPVVAVGVLAVERAVRGHELLGVVDARVAKIKVRHSVEIRGNVALLSWPLGLQKQTQTADSQGTQKAET